MQRKCLDNNALFCVSVCALRAFLLYPGCAKMMCAHGLVPPLPSLRARELSLHPSRGFLREVFSFTLISQRHQLLTPIRTLFFATVTTVKCKRSLLNVRESPVK